MLFKLGVTLIPEGIPEDECDECQREYQEYIFEAEDLMDLAKHQQEYCKKCEAGKPKIVVIEILNDVVLVTKD